MLEFRPLPPPTDDEVGGVLARIAARVQRLLRRRGLDPWEADGVPADPLVDASPARAGISSASVQVRIALGPRRRRAPRSSLGLGIAGRPTTPSLPCSTVKWRAVDGKPLLDLSKKTVYSPYTLLTQITSNDEEAPYALEIIRSIGGFDSRHYDFYTA